MRYHGNMAGENRFWHVKLVDISLPDLKSPFPNCKEFESGSDAIKQFSHRQSFYYSTHGPKILRMRPWAGLDICFGEILLCLFLDSELSYHKTFLYSLADL